MSQKFNTFSHKVIYIMCINDEAHYGLLKVGDTTVKNIVDITKLEDNSHELNAAAQERIRSYTQTAAIRYELLYTTLAVNSKGVSFRDYDVHEVLKRSGINKKYFDLKNKADEWFIADLETVKNALKAVKDGNASLDASQITDDKSPIVFRPEQDKAI